MKRWTAVLCAVLLLIPFGAVAGTFCPETAREGKQAALECFLECGFGAEYGSTDNFLTRWEDEIFIYAGGDATREDIEKLDGFLMELSFRVPFLPPVTRVESREAANITVMFAPLDELSEHVGGYVEGNWGFGTYYWRNLVRCEGEVAIASDVTDQKQRNHLIMEELIAVLAMTNDHYTYEDSIIYQPWTETQELSEVDWLMLNMMYHPALKPGMTAEEAERILSETF